MQTRYSEAIEMKKYVMEKFKIPEKSILNRPIRTAYNYKFSQRRAPRFSVRNTG